MVEGFEIFTYGDAVADMFDGTGWAGDPGDTEETIQWLADNAGEGPVLELGVGTGRVAVPLAQKGIEVHGIDASEGMLAQLRAKPGGELVQLHVQDFTDFTLPYKFSMAYAVFDTLPFVTDQESQIRCFQKVADVLMPGGLFVIQTSIPDPARYDRGQRTQTVRVEKDHIVMTFTRRERMSQCSSIQFAILRPEGIKFFPMRIRTVMPSEMDLMARLGGLTMESRWGHWDGRPLRDSDERHITIYRK
ncbi:class I SAM-dependent DNA methyltransferase [Micromonospora sp. NBC_01796]|uniref:class I SAM-dependent DNA methyltransferase n=1 Tax=Micromonospora sp. NBC_01796 TaxID=2975987 RepID=UPI002DD9B3CF|nr:class I SAM-dependent methyltransferase [Micromonospora sp. NBC_01796]WSA84116.1 class I SAM-dependent methyltransferase [Micromonospora sp. NBC_01796]